MAFQPSPYSYRSAVISMPTAAQMAQINPATLRKGSQGDDVRTLHSLLIPAVTSEPPNEALRVTGEWTGKKFGDITRSYVMQFQELKGLGVDGIVGRNTWSALGQTPAQAFQQALARVAAPDLPDGSLTPGSEPFYKKPWFVPVAVSASFLLIGTIFIITRG